MTIELNHKFVPTRDKVAAAKLFARISRLPFKEASVGHFAPVRVNSSLTMDFANNKKVESHHYAFKVSEEELGAIVGRILAQGIPYGSGPPNLLTT